MENWSWIISRNALHWTYTVITELNKFLDCFLCDNFCQFCLIFFDVFVSSSSMFFISSKMNHSTSGKIYLNIIRDWILEFKWSVNSIWISLHWLTSLQSPCVLLSISVIYAIRPKRHISIVRFSFFILSQVNWMNRIPLVNRMEEVSFNEISMWLLWFNRYSPENVTCQTMCKT